jgi:hypothetical protein
MPLKQPSAESEHVRKILEWRECLAKLPDNHFFELIRMYLGEVKTPYNKQKLIEELSAFIRREENRQTLVDLLSETDLQILSAVTFISDPTQEKLSDFFAGVFSFAALYERLLNLEERLILYHNRDSGTGKEILRINPLLEDVFAPYMTVGRLLPEAEYTEHAAAVPFILTPQFIASFTAYITANPGVCRIDGSLKKRAETALECIFPGKKQVLELLSAAFINLALVKENDSGFYVDYSRCEVFAQMTEPAQYAYICVASCGRFSREGFRTQAQLLLDCVASIPDAGFEKSILLRSGMLIRSIRDAGGCSHDPSGQGRFSHMLEKYRSPEPVHENSVSAGNILERLIDAAVIFGILVISGKSADGQDILTSAPIFRQDSVPELSSERSVLSINAGFTVTLMPGLPLKQLFPLIRFMDIVRYDTVAEFEISRKSVMRAFDAGVLPSCMLKELSDYALYGVPQNLKVCIDEWYRSYSSVALYSGYVLKADGSNTLLSEDNPLLAPHIKIVLAPGVYLLDIVNAEEASAFVTSIGLDFIGSVKTVKGDVPATSFPCLQSGRNYLNCETADLKSVSVSGREQNRTGYFFRLKARLESMNLDGDQAEGLLSRINRKIILNEAQLRPDSVRLEKIEAGGMDFMGKIRIIEHAITTNSMVEIGVNDKSGAGLQDIVSPRILGIPVSIEKQEGDAIVHLRIEPEQMEKKFSIGQATFVKRVRGSIFRETPGSGI